MENSIPNHIPRRRPPTPKLKFPLFGNSDSGGTQQKASEGDINPRHMMYLVGFMVLFMIAYEYYKGSKGSKITKSEKEIINAEWKGKVSKKFMGYDRPDINMFEMIDNGKTKRTVDISEDISDFFDVLMPRDSVYKDKGDLNVRIKNYTKDTTIVLQFSK
jgi:hypothetical protein